MKTRKVIQALRRNDCTERRRSGRHTIWACPCGKHSVPVPVSQRDHRWSGPQHREADGLSSEGVVAVSETYQVAASREGRWWLLDCGEHGATQALSLSSAVAEARDLIALVLDVDPDSVDVELTVHVSDALDLMIAQAREVAERAGSEQREAAARSRAVVRALLDRGVTGADAARILKVSPQRISQLAKSPGTQIPRDVEIVV